MNLQGTILGALGGTIIGANIVGKKMLKKRNILNVSE